VGIFAPSLKYLFSYFRRCKVTYIGKFTTRKLKFSFYKREGREFKNISNFITNTFQDIVNHIGLIILLHLLAPK
jgi:hypothetical protein